MTAWEKASDPRISNETAWAHSAPENYKEQAGSNDIMSDTTIANQEALWGQTNTN